MSRPMDPCQLVKRAVAGQHMRAFLAGDRKSAVSAIVSSQAGWSDDGGYGQVSPKGVGLFSRATGSHDPTKAQLFVTWAEVAAAIERGSRPELVEAFTAASTLWTAWCQAGGYGAHPYRNDMDEAEHAAADAHREAYGRATRAVREATEAIIDAGYADAPSGPVQGDLLELLGGAGYTTQSDLWESARDDEAALRRHAWQRLVEHVARPRPTDPVEASLAIDAMSTLRLAKDIAYGLAHQIDDTTGLSLTGYVRTDPWTATGWIA